MPSKQATLDSFMSAASSPGKDNNQDTPPKKKKKSEHKQGTVERIYQKKTQLEHILLRPDSYIGSVEADTQVR